MKTPPLPLRGFGASSITQVLISIYLIYSCGLRLCTISREITPLSLPGAGTRVFSQREACVQLPVSGHAFPARGSFSLIQREKSFLLSFYSGCRTCFFPLFGLISSSPVLVLFVLAEIWICCGTVCWSGVVCVSKCLCESDVGIWTHAAWAARLYTRAAGALGNQQQRGSCFENMALK